MLPVPEAVRALLAAAPPPEAEEVPLAQAGGRVLARDAVAAADLPGFRRAAMDGYAVRAADLERARAGQPVVLAVVGEAAAGRPTDATVSPGTAVRIATGAPLPAGADAVVRQEETRRAEDGRVAVLCPVRPGENVGEPDEDVRAGETVLPAGTLLGPAAVGVLASLGWERVPVVRRPVVHLVPTGDELVDVGEEPGFGQVRNSTAPALAAAARQCGAVPVLRPRVPDRLEAIASAVAAALAEEPEVVMTTGGASVGEYDLIRAACERLGAELLFWRVAMKPGMNVVAARRGRTLLLGLSGNPAAALCSLEVVVRPALTAMAGCCRPLVPVPAVLEEPAGQIPVRTRYLRVTLRADGGVLRARPAGSQLPSVLSSLAHADALAVIPPGLRTLPAGTTVEALLLPGAEATALAALAGAAGGRA